jgi:biotin transport system permease protein/energy-coupling factor transport system permease protein
MAVRREKSAMTETPVIFRYKPGKSLVHKAPAWIKLAFLFPLSAVTLYIPSAVSVALVLCMCVCSFLCGFLVREQLADLRAAWYYAVFLYVLAVLENWTVTQVWTPQLLVPGIDWLTGSVHLVLMLQISGLLFRTTTSLALKDGIDAIERVVRSGLRRVPVAGKHIFPDTRFAKSIALFIGFIPAVFELWQKIERAWIARGGGNGIKKIKALAPSLISLSFYAAAAKARALAARE